MFHKSPILFPTDFSHYALYAMKYAIAFAKKFGGPIYLAHVLDPALSGGKHGMWRASNIPERASAAMRQQAETRLACVERIISSEGVDVVSFMVQGRPDAEIVRLAEEQNCGLIAIATHGRTGFDHMVFGSVAERVVRNATVPVLCIKHPEHEFVDGSELDLHIRKILFPTDFSEYADQALLYAASLCREFNAGLALCHVTEAAIVMPEYAPDTVGYFGADIDAHAHEALARLEKGIEGVPVESRLAIGVPYREICRTAEELAADLIVMPAHGASGISHFLFGSVADKVVRRALCPVLSLRPSHVAQAASS